MKLRLKITKECQEINDEIQKVSAQINQKEEKYKRIEEKMRDAKTVEEQKRLKKTILSH